MRRGGVGVKTFRQSLTIGHPPRFVPQYADLMGEPEPVTSYFERVSDERFMPTSSASGGWDPTELHFSPLAGLIVHAIEEHATKSTVKNMVLSRLSYEILGRLAIEECEIRVEVTRPGRTIQLVEATVTIAGRTAVRASAWYLASLDTGSVAGGASANLPAPDTLARWPMTSVWPGGFVASLDVRPTVPVQRGRTTAWLTTEVDLVAAEEVSPLARFVALVDAANGIAVRESPSQWMFPNVDLGIHLHRQPEGRWVGLDTTVTFGPTGQGVTSAVLHDVIGPVGFAQQMLTVRPIDVSSSGMTVSG